ncbi:hypothetical protein Q5752_005653 [Cryptotrichosporon argae]
MALTQAFKLAMSGLVAVLAYTCMVLDCIMIHKVRKGEHTYPPAVLALLICAIFQTLFMAAYFVLAKRRAMSARIVAAATAVFACWAFGSVVATTALRHHHRYCGPSSTIRSDCAGVLRGTEGIGFALFGADLLYLAAIAAVVSAARASWALPLGLINGRRDVDEPDAEKTAGAH